MIDLGISKLALIGAVALIVIGPEKLPKVARTVGTLIGKAQRYVSDVKAEVNRAMELDELKKMKEAMESAAQNVQQSFNDTTHAFEKDWKEATSGLDSTDLMTSTSMGYDAPLYMPQYRHPGKKWRLKQTATPKWYKARAGVRTKALSGAARVARFRPRKDVGFGSTNP
jgi:sec-independent protein translocase protein TatB